MINECPGCAEVELIELLSIGESMCWLCIQIAPKPTIKPNRLDVSTALRYTPTYGSFNIMPTGWYRDDCSMQIVSPKGQRIDQEALVMADSPREFLQAKFIDENTMPSPMPDWGSK